MTVNCSNDMRSSANPIEASAVRKYFFAVVLVMGLSGCDYNTFQTTDEQIKASWAEVRSFPSNLTAMVFGYAVKANFTVTDEKALAAPPAVSFGASGAKTLIPGSPGGPK